MLFRIPNVTLPDGCTPSPTTLLLRPSPVGDYAYRLYFAEKVKTPKDKNWNASDHILGRTWHAFSWQAKEKVSLTQMVARLLRAPMLSYPASRRISRGRALLHADCWAVPHEDPERWGRRTGRWVPLCQTVLARRDKTRWVQVLVVSPR